MDPASSEDVPGLGHVTSRWHYVDIPFDSNAYDEARDCALLVTGDCVIKAIEREEGLPGEGEPPEEREENDECR